MKKKVKISLHRCICTISGCCLALPPAAALCAGGPAGPGTWAAGLLAACAVLLLLPVADEGVALSFRFALGALAVCAAGVLAGLSPRAWLPGVLAVQGAFLVLRSVLLYSRLGPLFRQFALWHGIENHARNSYSLALYLLAAAFPGTEAPAWAGWALLPLAAVLYVLLVLRESSGRTLFLSRAKELEIKNLLKGNLRPVPPQAGQKDEDVKKMSHLYERVVDVMEQKRPYLDPDFNLMDLASATFTNKSYLSRTINILSGRNFCQFVNYYRVQYALELMRKDHSLKMINLAMMCGFHSTVSFNMAFKLNMGETPTVYLERLREDSLLK